MGLKAYIQRNRKTILSVGAFTVLFSLMRVLFFTISYDTDEWMMAPEGTLKTWLGIGRYTLVMLKCLFGKSPNLFLLNIVTYVNVFIYTVLFLYFLNIDKEKSCPAKDILCAVVLVSSPVFLEQYYFTLQAAEVSFAMIFIIVSFITTFHLLKERKWLYGILTYILLVFCFGIYQSFVNLYVIGVLFCLYKLNREDKAVNLKRIGVSIIVFAAALVSYAFISDAVLRYFHMESSGYLDIGWFALPLPEALKTVVIVMGRILLGHGNVLNLSYTFCLVYVVYRMIKDKAGVNWKNFYLTALLISPFLLNVLTASRLAIRSVIGFPVLCAFIYWEYYERGKAIRSLLYLAVISQICQSQLLLYSDYVRYSNDKATAKRIYKDCNANETTVIVFRGMKHPEDEVFSFKGQAMGHSFFEWENDGRNANEQRILYFMDIIGRKLAYPNEVQESAADNISFQAEYPDYGYIIEKDGVYYVNLGEAGQGGGQ